MAADESLEVQTHGDEVRFAIRVSPRASRDEVGGVHGGALRVRIGAAPVDGAANRAVIALLAKRLGVAKSSVRIVRGESSRDKLVAVSGLDAATLAARLSSTC